MYIMKFTNIILALTIASAKEAYARRRLNTIVDEEPDSNASMSLASVLSPEKGGGGGMSSKSSKSTKVCDCVFNDVCIVYDISCV